MNDLKQKSIFLTLFALLAFISLQIPFSKLAGSNVSFTLFDFFAPMAGAFLGPVFGVIVIFSVEVVNFVIKQTSVTTGSVIRLFPILFAAFYFAVMGAKKDWIMGRFAAIVIPLVCMGIFIAHPFGREAWYFSLFWLIPVAAYLRRDILPLRSLGATFAAHAVGGAAWVWAFNLPASVWHSLIPVVITERILFAIGISVSYLITKHTLSYLISKKILPKLNFKTTAV